MSKPKTAIISGYKRGWHVCCNNRYMFSLINTLIE